MRRMIPSRSALLAFESASRHQSFSSAATELALSESAISRQIAALEAQLGLKLFKRIKKRVVLTKAGLLYSRQVRKSIEQMEQDMLNIMSHGGTQEVLELAVLPTFCSQWLIPRIGDFYSRYPDVTINMSARSEIFLFQETSFDAAIHFGQPNWPGTVADFLFSEDVVAVCNPDLINNRPLQHIDEIFNYPLLHLTSRPDAWRMWLDHGGISGSNAVQGARYEHFSILISATCAGLGIGLIPRYLVARELERKELMIVYELPVESDAAYYLIYPEENTSNQVLKNFKEWLLEKTNSF